jgi:hypothetical protein
VDPKPEELELSKCLPLFTLANLAGSRIFSNSLPIGTTLTGGR